MSRGEPIGEVECSHKGCTEVCKVYGFKARTPGRRSVFTGKKYFDCVKHGRVGADGSQTVTDYILENGIIWGANRPDATPEKPAAKPETPVAPPTPEPKPESIRSEPPPPRRRPASSPNSSTSRKPSRNHAPEPKPKPAPDRGWKPLID